MNVFDAVARTVDAGGITETAYKNMPCPVSAPSVGMQMLQIAAITTIYSVTLVVVVFIGK